MKGEGLGARQRFLFDLRCSTLSDTWRLKQNERTFARKKITSEREIQKSVERAYCCSAAHVTYVVLRFPCRQWTRGNTVYRVLYGRWLPVNYYAIYSPCTLPPRVYGYPFKALTWDAAHERERLTESNEIYQKLIASVIRTAILLRRAYRFIKTLLASILIRYYLFDNQNCYIYLIRIVEQSIIRGREDDREMSANLILQDGAFCLPKKNYTRHFSP